MGMQFVEVANLGCETANTHLEAVWQRSSLHPSIFDMLFQFLVFGVESHNRFAAEVLVEGSAQQQITVPEPESLVTGAQIKPLGCGRSV
jgi:hypothetical protein